MITRQESRFCRTPSARATPDGWASPSCWRFWRWSRSGSSSHPALASGDPDRAGAYLEELVERDATSENVVAAHYVSTETGTIEASSNENFVGTSPAEQGAPFAEDPPGFDGPTDTGGYTPVSNFDPTGGRISSRRYSRQYDTHVSEPFTIELVDHPIIAVLSPVEGSDHMLVYRKLRAFLVVLWLVYPVIWLVGPNAVGVMDVETTALVVSYIDIVSKVGFGLIALNGYVAAMDRDLEMAETTPAD